MCIRDGNVLHEYTQIIRLIKTYVYKLMCLRMRSPRRVSRIYILYYTHHYLLACIVIHPKHECPQNAPNPQKKSTKLLLYMRCIIYAYYILYTVYIYTYIYIGTYYAVNARTYLR